MSPGVLQEGRQAPQGQGQRQAPVSWASSEGHTQHLRPEGDKRGHLVLYHTLGSGSGHPVPAGDPTLGEGVQNKLVLMQQLLWAGSGGWGQILRASEVRFPREVNAVPWGLSFPPR